MQKKKKPKVVLVVGVYQAVNNVIQRIHTGYESMLKRLKKDEIDMPRLGGESLNTFYG